MCECVCEREGGGGRCFQKHPAPLPAPVPVNANLQLLGEVNSVRISQEQIGPLRLICINFSFIIKPIRKFIFTFPISGHAQILFTSLVPFLCV